MFWDVLEKLRVEYGMNKMDLIELMCNCVGYKENGHI